MTSNSESPDRTLSSIDGNCVARPKPKTSLRLRLGRVFSSNGLKSPKSVSSSRGSSPSCGSPRAGMRYSWQPGTSDGEENRSPRSPESGISTSSSSSIGINAASSPKSPSTPKSLCSSSWYLADSAGAAECATNEDERQATPPSSRTVRTIASTYKVRDGEEVPLPPPLLLLSSPVLGFDAPRRRVPQNATRRARNHCGTSTSLEESTDELGQRAAAINHESISGHEVLAAAAAEAEEVGEQRRSIHGRDVAVGRPGATQDLVDVVVDAGHLPLAVHRHVRLDAGVPAGVDAAPGRLLRSLVRERGVCEGETERRRQKGEEEMKKIEMNPYILNNLRL